MSGSKMDVVRLLTRRFRAQDINAPQDASNTANALQSKEEAHDSGTGSDEELIMAHVMPQSTRPFERTNASENQQHSAQVYDNPDANRSRDSCRQLSTSLGHSPISLSPVDFHYLAGGDDFERSGLGLEDLGVECSSGGSSSHEGEDPMTSRRKRPPLSDDSCIFSEDDDEDDDIEICELFGGDYDDDDDDDEDDDVLGSRLRCRRRKVVPIGSTSSPTFFSTIPFAGRGVSPLKRCRHDAGGTALRPNLDFYKMQKTSIFRRHCSINRPRPAKLMVLHGSQGQKSSAAFGPSSFTFRSLEFN